MLPEAMKPGSVGWTFDLIPVVWLLRRVPGSAGHVGPPAQGLHATTPLFATTFSRPSPSGTTASIYSAAAARVS